MATPDDPQAAITAQLLNRLNHLRELVGANASSPAGAWFGNAGVIGPIEEQRIATLLSDRALGQLRIDCDRVGVLPDEVEEELFESMRLANSFRGRLPAFVPSLTAGIGVAIRHRRIDATLLPSPRQLTSLHELTIDLPVQDRVRENEFIERVAKPLAETDLSFTDPLLLAQVDLFKTANMDDARIAVMGAVETLCTAAGMMEGGKPVFKVPTWNYTSLTQVHCAADVIAELSGKADEAVSGPAEQAYALLAAQVSIAAAGTNPNFLTSGHQVHLDPRLRGALYIGAVAGEFAKVAQAKVHDPTVESRLRRSLQGMADAWDQVVTTGHSDFTAREYIDRLWNQLHSEGSYPLFNMSLAPRRVSEALDGLVRIGVKTNGDVLAEAYDAVTGSMAFLSDDANFINDRMETYVRTGDVEGALHFARALADGARWTGSESGETSQLSARGGKAFVYLIDGSSASEEELRSAVLLLSGYSSLDELEVRMPAYVCDAEVTARALTVYLGRCMRTDDIEGYKLLSDIAHASQQPDDQQVKAIGVLSSLLMGDKDGARELALDEEVADAVRRNIASKLPGLITEMDPALHLDLVRARVTTVDPWYAVLTTFDDDATSISELALRAANHNLDVTAPELPDGDLRDVVVDPIVAARLRQTNLLVPSIRDASMLLNGTAEQAPVEGDEQQAQVRLLREAFAHADSSTLYVLSRLSTNEQEGVALAIREHVGVSSVLDRRVDVLEERHTVDVATNSLQANVFMPPDEGGLIRAGMDSREAERVAAGVISTFVEEGSVRWSSSFDDAFLLPGWLEPPDAASEDPGISPRRILQDVAEDDGVDDDPSRLPPGSETIEPPYDGLDPM